MPPVLYRRDRLANKKELINSLKAHPDNDAFINLTTYLKFRLGVIKDQALRSVDDNETKRLQGRGLEIDEFLQDLRRRPLNVNKAFTGSFDTI